MDTRTGSILIVLVLWAIPASSAENVIQAVDLDIKGDGKTDDVHAIQKMLKQAAGPARIVFPKGRTIRVQTAVDSSRVAKPGGGGFRGRFPSGYQV